MCGVVTVAQEPIGVTPHTEKGVPGYAPTCTDSGLTDGIACKDCGTTILDRAVIPATGHTYYTSNCNNCNSALTEADGLAFTANGDGTCYVSGIGSCTAVYILIPETYKGLRVTGIAANAFTGCDFIISIIIPDSVTVIGESAFSGCTALKNASLSGVTSIDKNAFSGCTSLSNVSIANTLTSIGEGAFSGCISLKFFFLPESVITVHESAFSGTVDLVIYSTVTVLPDGWSIINVTVSLAHEHSFGDWIITREPSCTYLGYKVQMCACGAQSTAEIAKLSHTEHTINGYAPTCTTQGLTDGKMCSVCGMTTVPQEPIDTAPHTEETVPGTAATCYETGLTDGKKCSVCNKITAEQQIIPTTHTYENGTCILCGHSNGSVGLSYQLSTDKKSYSVNGIGTCTDTDIIIPAIYEGLPVLAVAANAFKNNTTITSLTISDGVKTISEYAFYGCSSLRTVDFGNTVQTVGKHAFRLCTNLIHVVIPDSVTKLTSYAFHSCYRLSSVVIGSGVTAIEDFTFSHCYALSKVVLGKNVKTFGYDCFYYAWGLVEVYNLSGIALIERLASALAVHTSMDEKSYIYETSDGFAMYDDGETCYLISYNGYETNLVLPADCNGKTYSIHKYAFYKLDTCIGINSITLSNKITDIEGYSFYNLTTLSELIMPAGELTKINEAAFSGCSSLTEIIVPDGVTWISRNAFNDCASLKKLILPDTLVYASCIHSFYYSEVQYNEYGGGKYVGSESNPYMYLFAVSDTTVTSLEIHPDTKFIGMQAFTGCENLKEIVIPRGVVQIDNLAFSSLSGITVYIPDTVIYVDMKAFSYTTKSTIYVEYAQLPDSGWGNGWNNSNTVVLGQYKD